MSILRDPVQTALQELVVAGQKTADQLREATTAVDRTDISRVLQSCAERRQARVDELAAAIRADGDLPAVPDADREDLEGLVHHAAASFSSQPGWVTFVQQRVEAEAKLAQLLDQHQHLDYEPQARLATDSLRADVNTTMQSLQSLTETVAEDTHD